MFNLGFMEMVAIGAIALIFLGPKQIPGLARSLGRMVREFKKASAELSGGILEIKEEVESTPFDAQAQTSAEPAEKPSQQEEQLELGAEQEEENAGKPSD